MAAIVARTGRFGIDDVLATGGGAPREWSEDDVRGMLAHVDPMRDRDVWLKVGWALHSGGFPIGLWREWSERFDDFKDNGKLEREWERADDVRAGGVTMGTLVHLAKEGGWTPSPCAGACTAAPRAAQAAPRVEPERFPALGRLPHVAVPVPPDMEPSEQAAAWVGALFRLGETVNIVTGAACSEGRWRPDGIGRDHPAERLSWGLAHGAGEGGAAYLGAVLADANPEAGAWARVNPVDGAGVADANATAWRHALVECDEDAAGNPVPRDEQLQRICDLRLPCAAIVDSGGKSVHAIVKVDAADPGEHRERVRFLYGVCEANGLHVDRACRNPARLTRFPGAMRGGQMQRLIATDAGASCWAEWVGWVKAREDEAREEGQDGSRRLPPIVCAAEFVGANLPERVPALIDGVLRRGHKLTLTAPSKAGKTWCLMQLAWAVASGGDWLGFPCARGRVLYVDLETDHRSFANRLDTVRRAMAVDEADALAVDAWRLRGRAPDDLGQLNEELGRLLAGRDYDLIIIDPIYKVEGGDENSACDMAKFVKHIDELCELTGAAVAMAHHHAKGAAGGKASMDRGSGSGVFARDADAILDLSEVFVPEGGGAEEFVRAHARDGVWPRAWRLTGTLREFKPLEPRDYLFCHPRHVWDRTGELAECPLVGSKGAGSTAGGGARASRADGEWAERNALIGSIVGDMEREGVPASVRAVHSRYAESVGEEAPTLSAFGKWFQPSQGRCAWSKAPRGGNVWVIVPRGAGEGSQGPQGSPEA